ncbi:hypothetical protein [uncultured Alsobacter sp.]|uniref:hypothetical protein n=1 Tax=uncultured Alsobacter sp. TaxID=1748258 RepID=UPI0025EEFBD7|nr:hypothetical protein [uncultured Alsobacter sp.]
MRRLKHAALPQSGSGSEHPALTGASRLVGRMPDGSIQEGLETGGPLLAGASMDLLIRAPASGARYPSRRVAPHGPGAGASSPRFSFAVAGILLMGLVMLGVATSLIARDLLVPAFAGAAVAADEAPDYAARPLWPAWTRRS